MTIKQKMLSNLIANIFKLDLDLQTLKATYDLLFEGVCQIPFGSGIVASFFDINRLCVLDLSNEWIHEFD